MTITDIEELILGLLAERAGIGVEDLRGELLVGGDDMPIDSLLAVEILIQVQNATGVVLPANEETAQALLSIRGFAAAVMRQLNAHRSGEALA